MEDDNNTDTTIAATGIAVLQHNTTTIHNDSPDPEEMEEEVGLNTLAIGKNMIDSTGKVGRNTKKVVTYSQDLLGIGSKTMTNNTIQNDVQSLGSLGTSTTAVVETAVVDEEDNLEHIVPRISSSLPVKPVGGAINSSNVAQLVGNMKHFIESTLAEKQEEQLKQLQQGDNQLLSATGNSIENMFKTSNHSSTSSNIKHKAITSNLRVSNHNTSSMVEEEEGEVVEEGENEVVDEEVDEEFLAALKDLADKDIDTLRAIIAAAEQEEEDEEGEESASSDAEED